MSIVTAIERLLYDNLVYINVILHFSFVPEI